jgi:hypothetical protein
MLLRACAAAAFVAAISLVACSSPPGEPATGQSSEALICPIGDTTPPCGQKPPGGPTPTCENTTPECTVSDTTWLAETPPGGEAWIASLQQIGCSVPQFYSPTPNSSVPLGVTTCPVPLSELPPLTALVGTSYEELELGCNHCYPTFAPPGSVRIAWDSSVGLPGGCKSGSCDSM